MGSCTQSVPSDREIAKSDPVNFSSTASGSDEVCQVLPTPGAGRECLFFLQGRCAKGDACTYSHTPESGTGMRRGPCKFFGEGKCVKGDSCPFSHTVTKFTIPFDDALREPCKFFSLGKCLKGDLCMFRHSTTEVVTPISSNKPITRDPCKFFSEGKCIKGDACAWDHVLGPNSSFVASGVLHIPCKFCAQDARLSVACLLKPDLSPQTKSKTATISREENVRMEMRVPLVTSWPPPPTCLKLGLPCRPQLVTPLRAKVTSCKVMTSIR
jgi:hypothetical protein